MLRQLCYEAAVTLLDFLIDEVGEDESYPQRKGNGRRGLEPVPIRASCYLRFSLSGHRQQGPKVPGACR